MPIPLDRNIDVPIDVDLPLSGHLTTREDADGIDDDDPDAMASGLTTERRMGFAGQRRLPSESATGPGGWQPEPQHIGCARGGNRYRWSRPGLSLTAIEPGRQPKLGHQMPHPTGKIKTSKRNPYIISGRGLMLSSSGCLDFTATDGQRSGPR